MAKPRIPSREESECLGRIGRSLAKNRKQVGYRLVGQGPYGVEEVLGGMIYDLIDSKREAETICTILNEGIGPEWDKVEPELNKRKVS